MDIPIYCLLKLKESNNNIKEILSPDQYKLIIDYLALNVRKDKEIIIKYINEEEIDLSIYWDLVREEFINYCNNDSKNYGLFFLNRYRNLLEVLNPTKDEFKDFSSNAKSYFYHYIIKKDDKLYSLIPEELKNQLETDEKYKEKIEEEKNYFKKQELTA